MPRIKDSISRWLSEIQKAIKEHTEAAKKNQQADARERQQDAQSETKTVVRLPVEVTEYYRSEQSDRPIQNRRDRVRLCLEIIGVIVGLAIAVFTLCSLFVFNGQLKEMHRQTEVSERPWLKIDVKPQIINWAYGSQAVFGVRILMTNVGKSIAKNIGVKVKLFPANPGLPIALDAEVNQQKLCNPPQPSDVPLFDLFPTDKPSEQVLDVSVLPQAIADHSVKAAYPGQQPRTYVGLYVVGCVNYKSSFGDELRQTRFAYHLMGPLAWVDHNVPELPDGTPLMEGFEIGVNMEGDKIGIIQELNARNDAY